MTDYIAVYGSLRQGSVAGLKMKGAEYVGKDLVRGTLYDVSWFPGIKLDDKPIGDSLSGSVVTVEVFRLPEDPAQAEALLSHLDSYEGYYPDHPSNSLFVRKETVTLGEGLCTWVYEFNQDVCSHQIVESGDWLKEKENDPA